MPVDLAERILDIRDLSVSFFKGSKNIKAVDSVSFCIYRGETLGLVGESGSGKTVIALAILRLLHESGQITSGKVLFEDKDLLKINNKELQKIRGRGISMVFQDADASLNPVLCIGEQIEESYRIHAECDGDEAKEQALEILAKVGISEPELRFYDYPHQFSGGMKQRVAIAMALGANPKLLIADEPTTALDSTMRVQILDLVLSLKRSLGMSLLFISHDLGAVASVADRVAVMYAGRIVEIGSVTELMERPQHPYTIGLIESMLRLENTNRTLKSINGQPPDPAALPSGCAFHPRCPNCMPICKAEKPSLVLLNEKEHEFRCFLKARENSMSGQER